MLWLVLVLVLLVLLFSGLAAFVAKVFLAGILVVLLLGLVAGFGLRDRLSR
jgi:uncharacterized membrane-anchored protein